MTLPARGGVPVDLKSQYRKLVFGNVSKNARCETYEKKATKRRL